MVFHATQFGGILLHSYRSLIRSLVIEAAWPWVGHKDGKSISICVNVCLSHQPRKCLWDSCPSGPACINCNNLARVMLIVF